MCFNVNNRQCSRRLYRFMYLLKVCVEIICVDNVVIIYVKSWIFHFLPAQNIFIYFLSLFKLTVFKRFKYMNTVEREIR